MTTIRLITFSRPLALLAAERNGYFAREGLEVDCEVTRGSVEQIRGLLAGKWDVAHTAADNVMAYVDRENADLFVFLVADLGLAQKLIVQPDIQSYADLRGKVLGVDALDTGYAFVLRSMLEQNGLGRQEYELVSVGGTPQRLEALRTGDIVGCLLNAPPEEEALREGFRLLEPAGAYFPLYPGLTAATTRRWAAAHDDELVRYTRALLDGAAWAADTSNASAAIQMIALDQGVDADTARRRYEIEAASRTEGQPTGAQIESSLEAVRGLRRAMTGVGSNLHSYVDTSYMRRARETADQG